MGEVRHIGETLRDTFRVLASGRPEALGEYVVVPAGWWDDFRSVARLRGTSFTYSVEDADSGSVEYHAYGDLDIAEDILWAISREQTAGVG